MAVPGTVIANIAGQDVVDIAQPNIAELVGGAQAFQALVDDFYRRVEADPPLRAVYPADLEPGKTHLGLFLAQYFGVENIYSDHRGHPRLRMRHAGFRITLDGAMRWARHMSAAVRAQGWPEEAQQAVLGYFDDAVPMMINTHESTGRQELPTVIVGPGQTAI